MKHRAFIWSAIAIGGLMTFPSCSQLETVGDIEDIEIQADFAIPLINSKNTITEIITSTDFDLSNLTMTPEGVVAFTYKSEGPGMTIDEAFDKIPDFPFAIPEPTSVLPMTLFEEMAVNKMNLKEGTMSFELLSSLSEDIDVVIRIPSLLKNDQPLTFNASLDYTGELPVTLQPAPIDISGYQLTSSDQTITMQYEATVVSTGEAVTLDGVGGWSRGWKYDYLDGVHSTETIEIEADTMLIDLFELGFDGTITPANPELRISVENSFGFDVLGQLQRMEFINAEGVTKRLSGSVLDEGFVLNAPNMNEVGQSKMTTFVINKDNSNLIDLLSSQPEKVIYQLAATVNPNNTNATGFVTDKSAITSEVEAFVPIHGQFKMKTQQEAKVDFGQPDELSKITFNLTTVNEMPLRALAQFYFTDASGATIDSLFDGQKMAIEAAPVNTDGLPITTATAETVITIDQDRLDILKASENMLMELELVTSNDGNTPVKITPTMAIDIKLGAILSIDQ